MNIINFLPPKHQEQALYVDFCDIYQYAYDKYANYDDIKYKYRDILSLNEDAVRAIVYEFGFSYILDVFELTQGISNINIILGFLSAIHALKGHRSGLELVFQLFGLDYTLLEWWEIDPMLHSVIYDQIVNLNIIDFWEPDTSYNVWDMVLPPGTNGHKYICVVAGDSGLSEPDWKLNENETFIDNTVTWAEFGREWGANANPDTKMPPDVFALDLVFEEEDYGSSEDFITSVLAIIDRLRIFVKNYVYPKLAILNWDTIWSETWYPNWEPNKEYRLGTVILPSYPNENDHGYICIISGTTGNTEPIWPLSGTINDGTIVWKEYGKALCYDFSSSLNHEDGESYSWMDEDFIQNLGIEYEEDEIFLPECLTNCDQCSTNDPHILPIDALYIFTTAGLFQPWDSWVDTITNI